MPLVRGYVVTIVVVLDLSELKLRLTQFQRPTKREYAVKRFGQFGSPAFGPVLIAGKPRISVALDNLKTQVTFIFWTVQIAHLILSLMGVYNLFAGD